MQLQQNLEAVDIRQHHVQQDKRDIRLLLHLAQCILAVMADQHAKDVLAEHILKQFTDCRIVINHQNRRFHRMLPSGDYVKSELFCRRLQSNGFFSDGNSTHVTSAALSTRQF